MDKGFGGEKPTDPWTNALPDRSKPVFTFVQTQCESESGVKGNVTSLLKLLNRQNAIFSNMYITISSNQICLKAVEKQFVL